MAKATPKPTEVRVSVSVGGKVQLVKYEQDANYFMSIGRTYSTEGMTDEEVSEFTDELVKQVREEVEPHAAQEYDNLMEARRQLAS